MSARGYRGSKDRGGFRGGGRGQAQRGLPFHGRGGGGRGDGGSMGVKVYTPPDGIVPIPVKRVTDAEDDIQKSARLGIQSQKSTSKFPTRPGYSTRGNPVVLWANYVEMIPSPKLVLYRYNVSVTPEASGKKLGQIIRLFLETPEMAAVRPDTITDFRSTIIMQKRAEMDDLTIEIRYRSEGEDEPRDGATKYRVHLQYTTTLRGSDLVNYLTSTNVEELYDDKLPFIQAFNIFLNHYARSDENFALVGKNKTYSLSPNADRFSLGGGLTAIRGFFSSVRVVACRVLVNINVNHAAFYNVEQLDQVIQKFAHEYGPNKFRLNNFLKKLKIRTTHLPERSNKAGQIIVRAKTISGLATKDDGHGLQHPPQVKEMGAGPKDVEFWLEGQPPSSAAPTRSAGGGKKKGKKPAAGPTPSGRYVSVFDFFRNTHGIQILNPALPVVNVGNKDKPSYLPAQVCVVMPGQTYDGRLDPRQTQQMIRFAVRRPWENATSIIDRGLQTAGLSPQTNVLLGNFGVSVPQKLLTVHGRVLESPRVLYKENRTASVQFGSWNMLNVKFSTGAKLAKWSYLFISDPSFQDAFLSPTSLATVIDELLQSLGTTGMDVDKPAAGRKIVVEDPDDPQVESLLKRAAENLDLLFIILPSDKHPLYSRIKRLGDIKYGVPTISCDGRKLAKEKGRDQYLKNLALKFNLKLGGTNQIVDSIRRSIINEDKTMVVGIDVTHPSPGSSTNAPSVAGMVASVDKSLVQWPATLRIQSRARKEEVDNLTEMLKRHLDLWKSKGNHLKFPENILVYRDGVSEGQYDKVIEEELPQLRNACRQKYAPADQKEDLPNFTIIIVSKRHQTRFYPTSAQTADRFSNTQPGTVVDRSVTEPRSWDFFLQPHAAIQGTARPAHYSVLLDEIFRRRYKTIPAPYQNVADIVVDLTHGMSYNFGRANKAISTCTPARYADMVCDRARHYLSSLFDSPTHSATASSTGQASRGIQDGDDDVRVHPKLRDTMFYI